MLIEHKLLKLLLKPCDYVDFCCSLIKVMKFQLIITPGRKNVVSCY